MGRVDRFEDLVAWQKVRELTKQIYQLIRKEEFSRDFGLRDQIQRAAVSIMSNLAEGFERGGRAEFHQFVVIAKGSCAELRSQLYVALDAGYILMMIPYSVLSTQSLSVWPHQLIKNLLNKFTSPHSQSA